MDSLLFTLIAFVVALAILIAVHEFGHFWVARKLGVKVLRFSIGFGRPLWTRRGKVDDTEYVVAAVPLGGYVKMLDEREGPVAEHERHRAFNNRPLWVRSAVVVAGPLFNFLFAILAYWAIYTIGDVGKRPLVGEVLAESPAAVAGFQPGDEFLQVGERETPTWETTVYALLADSVAGDVIQVRVRDLDGMERMHQLPALDTDGLGEDRSLFDELGIKPERPVIPAVIGELVSGDAAEKAGLKVGDRILQVDGQPVADWKAWVEQIQASPENTLQITIERDGDRLELDLLPEAKKSDGGEAYGYIGAGAEWPDSLRQRYEATLQLGPVDALGMAMYKTWDISTLTLKVLGKMLIGEASVKNLSGPISIAQTAGRSASIGPMYFLKFLAIVSISLGVLNLLPIPVLDGGHLAYFLIEAVKGSPLSEEVMLQGQRIGLAILLCLMGLAFYVDFQRVLG